MNDRVPGARFARAGVEGRGAQSALRMPLRRISHIAVMSRRFSTRQKLIPLNLTNYQLPLFRMHPPRKGYQQDALFAGNKVELSPLYKVHRERAIFLVTFRPDRFSTRKQPQTKSREICTCKTKELKHPGMNTYKKIRGGGTSKLLPCEGSIL